MRILLSRPLAKHRLTLLQGVQYTAVLSSAVVQRDKLLGGLKPLPYTLFLPVSFSEIKLVEVLKSPAAAIYGFSAFHMNTITRDPDEMKGATIQRSAANTVSSNIQPCMQAG